MTGLEVRCAKMVQDMPEISKVKEKPIYLIEMFIFHEPEVLTRIRTLVELVVP